MAKPTPITQPADHAAELERVDLDIARAEATYMAIVDTYQAAVAAGDYAAQAVEHEKARSLPLRLAQLKGQRLALEKAQIQAELDELRVRQADEREICQDHAERVEAAQKEHKRVSADLYRTGARMQQLRGRIESLDRKAAEATRDAAAAAGVRLPMAA